MSHESAIANLVEALMAIPEYENPLDPLYEALGQYQPLTLRAIRSHSQLLHDHADQAQDQTFSINAWWIGKAKKRLRSPSNDS